MVKKWGCYNRGPYRDSLPVQDGYVYLPGTDVDPPTRVPVVRIIPFVNTRECHSGEGERCEGCSWLTPR